MPDAADSHILRLRKDEFAHFHLNTLGGEFSEKQVGDLVCEGLDEMARTLGGQGGYAPSGGIVIHGAGEIVVEPVEGRKRRENNIDQQLLRGRAFLIGNADVGFDSQAMNDNAVHGLKHPLQGGEIGHDDGRLGRHKFGGQIVAGEHGDIEDPAVARRLDIVYHVAHKGRLGRIE